MLAILFLRALLSLDELSLLSFNLFLDGFFLPFLSYLAISSPSDSLSILCWYILMIFLISEVDLFCMILFMFSWLSTVTLSSLSLRAAISAFIFWTWCCRQLASDISVLKIALMLFCVLLSSYARKSLIFLSSSSTSWFSCAIGRAFTISANRSTISSMLSPWKLLPLLRMISRILANPSV